MENPPSFERVAATRGSDVGDPIRNGVGVDAQRQH